MNYKNPIDKNFRPATWLIKDAFENIMKDVELEAKRKNIIFRTICRAIRSGNPREVEKSLEKYIVGTDWRWKTFDQWSIHFKEKQQWPETWENYRITLGKAYRNPEDAKKERDFEVCKILADYLWRTVYSLIRLHQWKDLKIDNPIKWELEVITEDNDPTAKDFADKFNNGEIDIHPPFFPGDRSCLQTRRVR